jgi:hypothetical protein
LKRGRRRAIPAVALAVSMAAAATLGTAIYLVSTSLPYLVDSAAADPQFGAVNRCLISHLRESRAGFAVSPGGTKVAAFGASSVAVCTRSSPSDGGESLSGALIPLPGITAASFDFDGTLWLAAARGPHPELWMAPEAAGKPRTVGEFAPLALAGVANGLAAVDGSGRLASFTSQGALSSSATVPPGSNPLLTSNSDGSLLSVVTENAIHVFRSAGLTLVRAESPCQAEFLWWLPDRTHALIACGPNAAWALLIDVVTGERESATPLNWARSALIPRLGTYVQGCEQLPCSVGPPQSVR